MAAVGASVQLSSTPICAASAATLARVCAFVREPAVADALQLVPYLIASLFG